MTHTNPNTTTHWAGLLFSTSDFQRAPPSQVVFVIAMPWIFLWLSHCIKHTEHTNYRTLYVNRKMKNARLTKTWHKLVTTYSKNAA